MAKVTGVFCFVFVFNKYLFSNETESITPENKKKKSTHNNKPTHFFIKDINILAEKQYPLPSYKIQMPL